MKTYIERFETMVDEIQAHPLLEVVDFNINPPATKEIFEAVEEKIGVKLDNSLRTFYGQTNGIKLHWRTKQSLNDKEVEEVADIYDDYYFELPEDEDIPFAQIHLLPLEECFIHRNWPVLEPDEDDMPFEFAGKIYSYNDFGQYLKPFDVFSTYNCMALFLEKNLGNPKVMLLGDHYIEWDHSRITNFESYMEMLIATRGIVESRKKIYSKYRGDLEAPLITGPDYWTEERIPKLFRKGVK